LRGDRDGGLRPVGGDRHRRDDLGLHLLGQALGLVDREAGRDVTPVDLHDDRGPVDGRLGQRVDDVPRVDAGAVLTLDGLQRALGVGDRRLGRFLAGPGVHVRDGREHGAVVDLDLHRRAPLGREAADPVDELRAETAGATDLERGVDRRLLRHHDAELRGVRREAAVGSLDVDRPGRQVGGDPLHDRPEARFVEPADRARGERDLAQHLVLVGAQVDGPRGDDHDRDAEQRRERVHAAAKPAGHVPTMAQARA
jgi:hypothetical protein